MSFAVARRPEPQEDHSSMKENTSIPNVQFPAQACADHCGVSRQCAVALRPTCVEDVRRKRKKQCPLDAGPFWSVHRCRILHPALKETPFCFYGCCDNFWCACWSGGNSGSAWGDSPSVNMVCLPLPLHHLLVTADAEQRVISIIPHLSNT